MSTTESSDSDMSGDCVVCGKRCWTRCSDCGANGTEWMYFCSTEHQKLIWHVHRRFCGVKSSPLRWPLLSESEADEAKEVLKELRRAQSGSGVRAKDLKGLGFIEGVNNGARADLERILGHILEKSDSALPWSAQTRSRFIAIFRRKLFHLKLILAESRDSDWRQSGKVDPKAWEVVGKDPIGLMLLSSGVVYDQLTSDDGKCEVWVEPLVHKLLICFTILAHRFQNPLQFDDLQPFLDYAQQEVARYLDQVVHGTNPELALRLKDALELGPGF